MTAGEQSLKEIIKSNATELPGLGMFCHQEIQMGIFFKVDKC